MKQPHTKGDKAMEKTIFKGYAITVSDEDGDVSKAKWDNARKHWRVTVKKDGKQVSYNYYGGSMAKVSPLDAFYGYMSDGIAYMGANDFIDFCDEFGYTAYDEYGRYDKRTKEVFHACEKIYFKLRKFIGTDDEIIELSNALDEEINR